MIFAPDGRELLANCFGVVLVVLSLGTIGASKFVLRMNGIEISVDESTDKNDR